MKNNHPLLIVLLLAVSLSCTPQQQEMVQEPPPAAMPAETLFTDHSKYDGSPSWSPDGKWIAFESERDESRDLWIKPVAGGEARQVTTDPAADRAPMWSPDGERLLFASDRDGDWDLWTVSPFVGERSATRIMS